MASFNKIIIVGYLGRDPEMRYTPQGTAVCNFSVATTEKKGDDEITTWFRVQVWGKQAENVNQYLSKGSQVYVDGRLKQDEYTDKEGNKRTTLEVNASDVRFLSKSEKAAAAGGGETERIRKDAGLPAVDDDSEIPF